MSDLTDTDYRQLATFRYEIRRFMQFSEQAAGAAGLTAQQHQALLAIRGAVNRALSVGELADYLLIKSHSASGLADRLEKLGMVERSTTEDSRRSVVIRLTPEAKDLLETLSAAHREEIRRIRPLLTQLLAEL